jgi:hypothetical protein
MAEIKDITIMPKEKGSPKPFLPDIKRDFREIL